VIDPKAPATVYAGTYDDGVFKTTDGGASWSPVNTGLTDNSVEALAIDPTAPATLYAGTRNNGVFKTTDGGASWGAVNTGLTHNSVEALAIDPTALRTLYAGTRFGGGVFKTTNGGGSWSAVNTGLPTRVCCVLGGSCQTCVAAVLTLAIDSTHPTTLYAGTYGGGVFSIQQVGGL